MLMYQHKAPHRNWQPGPKYLTMYDDVTIPEPDTLFDDYAGRGTPAKTQDMTIEKTMNANDLKLVPPRNLTPEQLDAWNAAYEPKNKAFQEANLSGQGSGPLEIPALHQGLPALHRAVDDNIGRVLDYLDATGLADNTIVIYCSDQGFYLGEHGWFDKRWMYEESLRTPLIVRWPGHRQTGQRQSPGHRLDAGFCRDVLRNRRRRCARRHAGPQPGADSQRPDTGRLAEGFLLPLLRVPGRPLGPAALRRDRWSIQADSILRTRCG